MRTMSYDYHTPRTIYSANTCAGCDLCAQGGPQRRFAECSVEYVPRTTGNEKWLVFRFIADVLHCIYGVGCIKVFERFSNISLQNVEEKVGPKVFWLFVFGHFFCPFLKRGY